MNEDWSVDIDVAGSDDFDGMNHYLESHEETSVGENRNESPISVEVPARLGEKVGSMLQKLDGLENMWSDKFQELDSKIYVASTSLKANDDEFEENVEILKSKRKIFSTVSKFETFVSEAEDRIKAQVDKLNKSLMGRVDDLSSKCQNSVDILTARVEDFEKILTSGADVQNRSANVEERAKTSIPSGFSAVFGKRF